MADDGTIISQLNPDALGAPNGADNLPAAGIISQYIKDLSVENPNAPESYKWQEAPQLDVQFNIAARPIEGELHEVELKIQITAKVSTGTVYIIDLTYGAMVGMRNLDEANMHAFAFSETPRLIFPFVRRVVADAVRDAGYQPLVLDPIDFNGLYIQQMQAQAAQAGAPAEEG